MTVSVREVGGLGLDCIGPRLTMTQWMNRMMLQLGPVHQATMQYTENCPPSRLIKSYIIERKLSLRFQENSNTFDRTISEHRVTK